MVRKGEPMATTIRSKGAIRADPDNDFTGSQHWCQVLKSYVVDEVVAVSPWSESSAAVWDELAEACADRGIIFRLLVLMPPPRVGSYRVEEVGPGSYFLSLESVPQDYPRLMIKRMIDIVGALCGLSFCALVYPLYALWLRLVSPGPILFRQCRLGRNGRLFTLYKFRTMHPNAEQELSKLLEKNEMRGAFFKIKNDPRVIRGGHSMRRTHLDELPQFWNVLTGDMSLVGTRPPTPDEARGYLDHHYRRLSMRPGLTGLWQVSGNGSVRDFEDVVKLDCTYIDNWSLAFDLKLIVKTATKVVARSGW